ncbi:MAG TPA: hypothetical protein ENK84_07300 [Desulfobulbus sp.]|nr:hypothetical protein [Desulfobulbus sp.]HHD63594.1 hypothetical protein [Desulfobulbaceae bacterium]
MNQSKMPQVDLQPMQEIAGWEEFFQDGEAYLKTAAGAHKRRKEIFTAEILYNLVAMAIEKFVMAALMRHGAMPYNHTMVDLVEAMEQNFPDAMKELREPLLELDKYQEICDLDTYTIKPPTMGEIPSMLGLAEQLKSLVVRELL